jgi:hypothetical protein
VPELTIPAIRVKVPQTDKTINPGFNQMEMKSASRPFGWMFRLVKLSFASALFIASIIPSWASAQSSDDPWGTPVNLSHSGVGRNPDIVIDSGGVVHVVWEDDLANFIYSKLDGDQWSTPELTDLNRLFQMPHPDEPADPLQLANYTGPNPLLIASPDQRIFAFWIKPEGRVLVSNVENEKVNDYSSWGTGRLVAPGAASFAAAVDAGGGLHVAFLRPQGDSDNPPGIYYAHSTINGGTWTKPVLLYESPYFRRLGRGEANLSIATAGTEDALRVYVAWDNRPRKQVFMAQSADGGETWEQPTLVAGPEPDSGLAGPFNIHIGAAQNSVVLVWQSGQPTDTCSQIYEFSKDRGTTWSNSRPLAEDLLECPQSMEFVTGLANRSEDPLYFLTETKSKVLLTAWTDLQWSQPQEQSILSGFEEPEIYTPVILGCRRPSLSGERLYVVGCDQGQGGDVWVTSRDLGAKASGLQPPVWSQLSPVTPDHLALEAVELVATDDGLIHAFFSQHQDTAIYYTKWDGEAWSRTTPVLKVPDGEAGSPVITVGPGNQLFLITPNKRGSLYFSRAISGNGLLQASWSPPARLAVSHDGKIGSVDVTWDAAGTLYVAYSVPVNQERGIYVAKSKDQGTTWSEPLQVFDGAAQGFDFIGAPSLQTSADGALHVIWKVQSIQGDGVPLPLSLYYARSEDGLRTFSDAAPVVEEPVAWQELATDGKGDLHLLWQPQDAPTTLWDQISLDGGHTWQYPEGLPQAGKLATVTRDPAGRLHLVGVVPGTLGHWLWDGGGWHPEATLHWSSTSPQERSVDLLGAAVNKQGKMIVVLAEPADEGDPAQKMLLYSIRTLELPRKQPATQEVPTQTLLPPTLTPIPPTPERLSTPNGTAKSEPTDSQSQTNGNVTNDPVFPFTMALLPVALLLIIILGVVIRGSTRGEDR